MKLISLFFIFFLFAAPASAEDITIMTLSGKGASTLRPFTVNDEWEIQWQASQSLFSLILHPVAINTSTPDNAESSAADRLRRIIAEGPEIIAMDGGPGTHYMPRGGKYYLEIAGLGKWTIKIVEIQ